jgi:ribosome modulation factor
VGLGGGDGSDGPAWLTAAVVALVVASVAFACRTCCRLGAVVGHNVICHPCLPWQAVGVGGEVKWGSSAHIRIPSVCSDNAAVAHNPTRHQRRISAPAMHGMRFYGVERGRRVWASEHEGETQMVKSTAYWEGYSAGSDVCASMACPYSFFTEEGADWQQGWEDGDAARRADADAA